MVTYFRKLLEPTAHLAVQQIVTTCFSWNSSKDDNITQLPPSCNSKTDNESWRHADCYFLFFCFLSATPYSMLRYQQRGRYRQPNPQDHFHSDSSDSVVTEEHKLLTYVSMKFCWATARTSHGTVRASTNTWNLVHSPTNIKI